MGRILFSMLSWLLWAGYFANIALGQAVFVKGQKWQIILTGQPDMTKMPLPPLDAPVWDIDLFDNEATTITLLKASGKIVICYFSAGTVEDWRDDAKEFPPADVGKVLPLWPNEKWVRTGSTKIRDIMTKRIKLAADKGCDAIDPDNTDAYQNDNGLNLKNTDAIDYMRWMQKTAAGYGMKIGLKNSLDILDTLTPIMDFAVNEECASPQFNECLAYDDFLAANKPVFHIEYPNPLNLAAVNGTSCHASGTAGMSTVLKELALGGKVIYCDGSQADTPTKGGSSNPGRPTSRPTPPRPTTSRGGQPPRPTTTRGVTPPLPSSSPRPTSTPRPPSTIRSTARPTSTPGNGGGGGCRQKHWDQCGGQDWKGCTTCESPYTCKGVSPPYYYQCL